MDGCDHTSAPLINWARGLWLEEPRRWWIGYARSRRATYCGHKRKLLSANEKRLKTVLDIRDHARFFCLLRIGILESFYKLNLKDASILRFASSVWGWGWE
jgi:hypothetical protein